MRVHVWNLFSQRIKIGFPIALTLVLSSDQHIRGAEISIVNASFESGTTGWTNAGGVFSASPPLPGMFVDPVPDGTSVLYLGGASPGPAFASQTLGATVEADATYVLDFWIGFRAEPHIEPTSYSVSLLPFASPGECGLPARGEFMPCSLIFTASPADIGLPLTIRLDVTGPNAVNQVAFDDFRLQITDQQVVPEPSQVGLVIAVLGMMLLFKDEDKVIAATLTRDTSLNEKEHT